MGPILISGGWEGKTGKKGREGKGGDGKGREGKGGKDCVNPSYGLGHTSCDNIICAMHSIAR